MPRINLSGKLSSDQSLKGSIESRQGFYDSSEEVQWQHRNILTDYSLFFSNKLGAGISLNIGYMLRSRGDSWFHRASQHFNLVQRLDRGRIGHRIASDQTFVKGDTPVFRLRYRAVLEQSLSGARIDDGELYYKLGSEVLYALEAGEGTLEWRLVPQLGYELSATSKLELGWDARFSSPFDSSRKVSHWLRTSWFYSFKKAKPKL